MCLFKAALSSLLARVFSRCGEWGRLQLQSPGSPLQWLRLWSSGSRRTGCSGGSTGASCDSQALECAGFGGYGAGLSCSKTCGIFLDQGPNSCPLHWLVDFPPLSHQGSPGVTIGESDCRVSLCTSVKTSPKVGPPLGE